MVMFRNAQVCMIDDSMLYVLYSCAITSKIAYIWKIYDLKVSSGCGIIDYFSDTANPFYILFNVCNVYVMISVSRWSVVTTAL